MKSVSGSCPSILNSKVKPLAVTLSSIVIFHVEFILIRVHFYGFSEVSWLKPRFENKSFIQNCVNHLSFFVLLFLVLDTVVRFNGGVVSVEARTCFTASLFCDNWAVSMIKTTVLMRLFKAVRQVLRVEVVPFLIGFINSTWPLLSGVGQLNQVFFVNVGTVFSVFALIIGWILYVIVDHLKIGITGAPLCFVANVLVKFALRDSWWS